MVVKLPFGIRDGNLLHISEVESGMDCECVCPSCNTKLIARKGKTNTHCFAHYNAPDCEYSLETSLHFAAKRILEEKKAIKIPRLTHNFGPFDNVLLLEERFIEFDEVHLEKKLFDIRPDVILTKSGVNLLIEIAVTHFIDDNKLQMIKELGISCIEIYLGDLLEDSNIISLDELEQIIINDTSRKYWIYNIKEQKLIDKAITTRRNHPQKTGIKSRHC